MLDTAPVYLGRHPELAGLRLRSSGKVRDVYDVGDGAGDGHLLFVTTDRVSAFDVVMPRGIPHKGRVLTAIAAHWFAETRDIVPNHLVGTDVGELPLAGADAELREELRGRLMLVRRCEPTSVEWVVRGYLAGSGWKEYQRSGTVSGIALPRGLEFCGRLPRPILTPTTKEETHDLPLTLDEARERVGSRVFERAHDAALALFRRGTEVLARRGLLLADTKFEFGLRDGELLLIDEALTPDSSRFWSAAEYRPGTSPPSYDKQILRDYLEGLDWDKNPPGPELPDALVERVAWRYLEICRLITGEDPEGLPRPSA